MRIHFLYVVLISVFLAPPASPRGPEAPPLEDHGLGTKVETVTGGRAMEGGQTLEDLKVGRGIRKIGDSLVSRNGDNSYIVCAMRGQECVSARTPTEVMTLVEGQKAAAIGAKGKPEGLVIAEIIEQLKIEVAEDYSKMTATEWAQGARNAKKLTTLVNDINNIEEGFSSKLEKILKSKEAEALGDHSRWLLTSLLFSERAAFVAEKLRPLVGDLQTMNVSLKDPRLDAIIQVLTGKNGFLGAYRDAYLAAQTEKVEAAQRNDVFNSVGCPSCLIQRELQTEMLAMMGMSRKQLPRDKQPFTTQDFTTFIDSNGDSWVIRNGGAGGSTVMLLGPDGKERPLNPGNAVEKAMNQARIDHQNNRGSTAADTKAAVQAPAPIAETSPATKSDWASGVKQTNTGVEAKYAPTIQRALTQPTAKKGATVLFTVGNYYEHSADHKDKMDRFLAAVSENQASELIKEYLTLSPRHQYAFCPSCFLAAKGNWDPNTLLPK